MPLAIGAERKDEFTASEAAAVTALPVKEVHRAIDAGPVQATRAKTRRCLNKNDLVYLRIVSEARRGGQLRLSEKTKIRLYDLILRNKSEDQIALSNILIVDLRQVIEMVNNGLKRLRAAERMVVSDPDIRGGEPVIRGTRIPVYQIADMMAGETTEEEILEGYPTLGHEKIELAQLYAQAHPRRGRPTLHPWHAPPN